MMGRGYCVPLIRPHFPTVILNRRKAFTIWTGWTQIKRLGCGAILATYGRPGLFVKFSGDEAGMVWSDPIEIKLATNTKDPSCYDRSCYYTRILPLDDNSALMVYSDFNYPENGVGESKKSILVRKLTVIEE